MKHLSLSLIKTELSQCDVPRSFLEKKTWTMAERMMMMFGVKCVCERERERERENTEKRELF